LRNVIERALVVSRGPLLSLGDLPPEEPTGPEAAPAFEIRLGASIEQVGFFNPRATGADARLRLDLGRIDYWTGQGAEVSDRVKTLVAGYRKQGAAQAPAAPAEKAASA